MSERSVIFKSDEVRAILRGKKTQFRRLVSPQPLECKDLRIRAIVKDGALFRHKKTVVEFLYETCDRNSQKLFRRGVKGDRCPFGRIGDKLWVRETFWAKSDSEIFYKADRDDRNSWKPSSQMKRGQSRVLLEITNIRVERVEDITEKDSESEGFISTVKHGIGDFFDGEEYSGEPASIEFLKEFYTTYSCRKGLQKNPWVWVVEFKILEV